MNKDPCMIYYQAADICLKALCFAAELFIYFYWTFAHPDDSSCPSNVNQRFCHMHHCSGVQTTEILHPFLNVYRGSKSAKFGLHFRPHLPLSCCHFKMQQDSGITREGDCPGLHHSGVDTLMKVKIFLQLNFTKDTTEMIGWKAGRG